MGSLGPWVPALEDGDGHQRGGEGPSAQQGLPTPGACIVPASVSGALSPGTTAAEGAPWWTDCFSGVQLLAAVGNSRKKAFMQTVSFSGEAFSE